VKKRKIIFFGFSLAAVIAAYLLLARFFIFYRIKFAGLIAPNRQDVYFAGADKAMAKNLLYVALGDSLTAGTGASNQDEAYAYLLARNLAGEKDNQVTFKNFSYPGARTSDLINDLLNPAIVAKPDLVTLLIGTNDVFGGVSREVFKKNYQLILERLTKEIRAKIYLINLPHLGLPKLLLAPYNYYFAWRTDQFNKIIRELAEKYNLSYIDLDRSTRLEFKKDRLLYAPDLFHPSAAGYKLWARIIYDDINK